MPSNTQKPAQPGAKPAATPMSAKPASGKPSTTGKPASGGKK